MPEKKYIGRLRQSERQQLIRLVKTGTVAAYKRQRAQILLKADIGPEGPGLKDADIVTLLEVSCRTVERTRQRLVEVGLEKALEMAWTVPSHLWLFTPHRRCQWCKKSTTTTARHPFDGQRFTITIRQIEFQTS